MEKQKNEAREVQCVFFPPTVVHGNSVRAEKKKKGWQQKKEHVESRVVNCAISQKCDLRCYFHRGVKDATLCDPLRRSKAGNQANNFRASRIDLEGRPSVPCKLDHPGFDWVKIIERGSLRFAPTYAKTAFFTRNILLVLGKEYGNEPSQGKVSRENGPRS